MISIRDSTQAEHMHITQYYRAILTVLFVVAFPSFVNASPREPALTKGKSMAIRQVIERAPLATETVEEQRGMLRKHLVVPELIVALYEAKPRGVLTLLKDILEHGGLGEAQMAYCYAIALYAGTEAGALASTTRAVKYDEVIEKGRPTRRKVYIRQIQNFINKLDGSKD